jgi:hypothetical protein
MRSTPPPSRRRSAVSKSSARTSSLREAAGRALAVHPLRAADALQLAAALVWSDGAIGESFVCLDAALRDAARREGFDVRPDG